jgi:DNA-binding MarR family transcriptional regulator
MGKNGLLIKTQGNEDRRTVYIQLTEKGDILRKQVREKLDQLDHAMTNNLTQNEIKKLQQIVTTLSHKNSKKQAAVVLS